MRTTALTLSPNSRPETLRRASKDEEATADSPRSRAEQEGHRTCPPSILRRNQPEGCSPGEEPRRSRRRVRFQEPLEAAVHYIARRNSTTTIRVRSWPSRRGRGSLFLRLSVCILLVVALGLCCGRTKPIALALEDLWARVLVLALRLWHTALEPWL
uniref:Chromosome 14 open reading frame 180 n=2 Tax=Loxodonta africana TaxID=9785 RepID=G3U0W5_LOXAF